MKLKDRIAVVTGAAHGLGKALAEVLGERGAQLALLDVDAAGLEQAAAALATRGARAQAYVVDVADARAMEEVARRVAADFGEAVHLLVNNAGVSVQGPFEELDLEDLRWIFDINFWGVVHGCRSFLPQLRRADRARIVNILSDFGLLGFPTKTGYVASKFAARGFGESLRAELHGSAVGLTAVYPPAVDTDILRRSRAARADKREAEARFLAARGWPAPEVAERIVRAVERERDRVLLGKETWAIDLLTRLAPALTQRLVGRFRHRIPFV